ncbi:MAG TPA: carotenoid oxygenase family protein [Solirubrobacteraceae bacterium]|jgi:beta,beta-carotene 9',10'-dioxygenase|nr:carotenoid oxygenase family protein [Solirubrobacteraceae bacterium]
MQQTRIAGGHRLGFQTLDEERSLDAVPVEGALPAWLTGSLLRTGPAKFEAGERGYRHWFDGLAMLHRFSFADGAVSYANRFLESRAYRAAREQNTIVYSEFATDPCRTLFKRVATAFSPPAIGDNANVNLTRLGDEFLAMTETPLPVVFDPHTLATLGVGEPAPGQLTVAHPHQSPKTGELVSYATHFGPYTTYRVYAQQSRGRRRMIAKLGVSRPAYMHSFAITERYVVLVEFPFVAIPIAIPLSGRPFIENFHWRPQRGTRFHVIELETGKLRGTYEGEPFFAFHHVNAFERDGELVIDLCAYQNAEIVRDLYLDHLRQEHPTLPEPELRRCRLRLDGSNVEYERLADVGLELPRIDYRRCNGRAYRYVYGVGQRDGGDFLDQLVKVNVERGDTHVWCEPGTYPGEPVFVPEPDATGEDAGVLLTVVLDAAAGSSFLLVLDAGDLHELARARVPHHIPFGFHGQFATSV